YLQLNPPDELLAKVKEETEAKLLRRQQEEEEAKREAKTTDGHKIHAYANFSNHEEADHASDLGAEGVGLMRSEFLFLNRGDAPSEEEQDQIYTHMTREMGPERPVTIRTLDVGGDKPLTYCPLPDEDNPFLGERGIRMLLREENLFRTQVRAVLRASQWGPLRLMIPMITNLSEVIASKRIIQEEADKLKLPMIPVGIMIEVPAAVMIADHLAKEVSFFSIGTNDLTQYVLAMDRNHQALAKQVDALHPAVLKMIELTALSAQKAKIELGVCGGLAGDDLGIPVLLGLGINELSVSLPSVPGVKARIREMNLEKCRKLAKEALSKSDAQSVRDLVNNWYEVNKISK
ncbi:MAG: phosphoenolpyruvate--protein phosphotransferase, partial [Bdellovibrionales bacterium]|nr:phosphoenolpyruvate--protein phosphotransferase [Bdellovibrionales bacterium]